MSVLLSELISVGILHVFPYVCATYDTWCAITYGVRAPTCVSDCVRARAYVRACVCTRVCVCVRAYIWTGVSCA